MPDSLTIRPITPADYADWLPLWDGYNAFYERHGATALPLAITQTTWARFLDPAESMHAFIALKEGAILGLVHFLYHRSMIMVEPICYLSDLFTVPAARGLGVGRALIGAVYAEAKTAGASRVYWQTHASNAAARSLYDKVSAHYGSIVYRTDI